MLELEPQEVPARGLDADLVVDLLTDLQREIEDHVQNLAAAASEHLSLDRNQAPVAATERRQRSNQMEVERVAEKLASV